MAGKAHRPYRLLLVTNRLLMGGAERMLVTLAESLDPQRVRPVVACYKEPGPLAAHLEGIGVPVHAHLLRHKMDVVVIERLCRLIRSERIDVVCPVGSGGDRMFWSTLAARRAGVPVIVWSHEHPTPGHSGFERANRALYRWVDRFVALGRRHREALARLEHVPLGRIAVVRNGIDASAFNRPDLRAEARARLDLHDDQVVAVGIIANLRPAKRHDVFIDAAARVAPDHPQARFYIIGDGPERDAVEHAARASGVSSEQLRLMGERHDVPVLLQGLDIVCLCSAWQECLSVVMLEAMAAERAFVAPHIGSLDEALIDGKTGRVVRQGDPACLASVLTELIDDGAQRARLGEQARTLVFDQFTAAHMARCFERVVASVVLARRSRRP